MQRTVLGARRSVFEERIFYREMQKMWYHKVTDSQKGYTVGWILKNVLGLSKKQISQVKFREKGISVNGDRQRVTYQLQEGDKLQICLEEKQDSRQIEGTEGELAVLYEDEDILVVEKPSGQICHPSGGHYRDSLANQLVAYFRHSQSSSVIRIVGRLDQDTSGIVVAAKNRISAQRLAEQRSAGEFCKDYLALVHGEFQQRTGEITDRIGILQRHPLKMQVCDAGKNARTRYQVLESAGGYSLVQCTLETGRTHQIRVHMQNVGHTLINDRLYGLGEEDPFWKVLEEKKLLVGDRHRQLGLHACRVCLRQPFTGKKIEIHSVCEFSDWMSML